MPKKLKFPGSRSIEESKMKTFLLLAIYLIGTGAKSSKPKGHRPTIPENCLKYIPDIITYVLSNKEKTLKTLKTPKYLKMQKLKSRSRRLVQVNRITMKNHQVPALRLLY